MVEIFDPRAQPLTDDEILSFFHMLHTPDQTKWDYEEPDLEIEGQPEEVLIDTFRSTFLLRQNNYALWAREAGQIVGMVGINRFEESSRAHCAELGVGVATAYQRQGIGYRLVSAIVERAREVGLKRLEADCLVENEAVIALLRKASFQEEGTRIGAVQKQGAFRSIRLFGLLL